MSSFKTNPNAKTKLKILFSASFGLLLLLPLSKALALSYTEIVNSQQSRVLGSTTSASYPYPSGSLVSQSGTIYFISGTFKIPFTSYQAFSGLGYSLKNVAKGDLSAYGSSTYVISTPNVNHPYGSWVNYKNVVYYITSQGLIGVPSAAVFTNNGGSWNMVVKTNKYDISILNANPHLAVLTNNDPRIYGQSVNQFANQNNTGSNSQSSLGQNSTSQNSTSQNFSANLNPSVPTISVPQSISVNKAFTASAFASDAGANNLGLTYLFYWGDGTATTTISFGNAAAHTYIAAGTYTLTVTATDSQDKSNSGSATVNVAGVQDQTQTNVNPSVPQITETPANPTTQSNVTFTATATDPNGQPLTFTFNWGDGSALTTNTTGVATHAYANPNTYTITITATNTVGNGSSNNLTLTVIGAVSQQAKAQRDAQRKTDLQNVAAALTQYKNADTFYPVPANVLHIAFSVWDSETGRTTYNWGSWGSGGGYPDLTFYNDLVGGGFLSALPIDPINKEGGATNYLADGPAVDLGYVYYSADGKSYILGTNLETGTSTPGTYGNYQLTGN
jgi:hypothetical protein